MNVDKKINKSFKAFLKNTHGAAVIEFFFSIIVLLMICFFMFDYAYMRGTLGKLDNISYSLANILSVSFHNDTNGVKETIEQRDLEEFQKLAKSLYFGNPNDPRSLAIHIASLEFAQTDANQDSAPNGKLTEFASGECKPYTPLNNLKSYAPRSEVSSKRTLPLYQITLCVEGTSIFKGFVLGEDQQYFGKLRSTSTTIGR